VSADSIAKPAWPLRAGFVLCMPVLLAAIGGCAKDRADEHAGREQDAGGYQFPCLEAPKGAAGAPTFSALYRELFCRSGCANIYCHGSRGANAGLSFETVALAYAGLVGVAASSDSLCAGRGLLRVEPGAPDGSLLLAKVSGQPECGQPMPPPAEGYPVVAPAQLDQLRSWIEAGAEPN
jgi:predicted CxxxxCH...CXXCH cytochrome family protein